ncbi:MAG: hypothetical protein ACREDJ_00080 [Methylocella sp.]
MKRPAGQDRPGAARRRARWKKYQARSDPAGLACIGETWVILRRLSAHQGHLMRFAQAVFAKLQHLMRKAKERTAGAAWKRTGALLESFKPNLCQNYLVNAGSASS